MSIDIEGGRVGGAAAERGIDALEDAAKTAGDKPWWGTLLKILAALAIIGVVIVVAAFNVGCSVDSAYRDADSATYKAIEPEYRTYVERDAALSPEQKQRRYNTLDSWKLRIDAPDK